MIHRLLLSSLAALGMMVHAGCSDDQGGETENARSPEHGMTEDTASTTHNAGATPDLPTTDTDVGERSDDRVGECLDRVERGDLCGECACRHCIEELADCEVDVDCKAIRECAHAARCTGIACLRPCGDVIEMHGGPFSPPGLLAQTVGACVDKRCMDPC